MVAAFTICIFVVHKLSGDTHVMRERYMFRLYMSTTDICAVYTNIMLYMDYLPPPRSPPLIAENKRTNKHAYEKNKQTKNHVVFVFSLTPLFFCSQFCCCCGSIFCCCLLRLVTLHKMIFAILLADVFVPFGPPYRSILFFFSPHGWWL